MEDRNTRLNAAIALFRSEASASGYVVEEVRLCLPVRDIDVRPRVIIAQHSTSSAPPTLPNPEYLKQQISYPVPHFSERMRLSVQESHLNCGNNSYGIASNPMTSNSKMSTGEGRRGGFKRTLSGSVIIQPIPRRGCPSQRERVQPGNHCAQGPQNGRPLGSIPYIPIKESIPSPVVHNRSRVAQKGEFWKTVIGEDKGKSVLRAAESMHRMRHGALGDKCESLFSEDKKPAEANTAQMDICESINSKGVDEPGSDKEQSCDALRGTIRDKDIEGEDEEKTHHINGHDIPESHVQLLLSSVADISAREQKDAAMREEVVDEKQECEKETLARQVVQKENLSSTRPSRNRRDNGDRRVSRGQAARPFQCHICPSSFDREGHLRVHILAVHEKKRPFVCQICDASFGHSSSLLRHGRTVHQASPPIGSGKLSHTRGSKPRSSSDTLKSDELSDGMEDDEKHFKCSDCSEVFNRVALLNRHVAEKHFTRSPAAKPVDGGKSP